MQARLADGKRHTVFRHDGGGLQEVLLDSVAETFKSTINTKNKDMMFRFLVCISFGLLGLIMTTGVKILF